LNKFHLKIISREGLVFEGDVDSITSYNNKGKFDVLSLHANFISLIQKGVTIKETKDAAEKQINFDNALMKVKQNLVEIYLGIEKAN